MKITPAAISFANKKWIFHLHEEQVHLWQSDLSLRISTVGYYLCEIDVRNQGFTLTPCPTSG